MQIESVGQQKMEFLNLLVTELQNQNPLEPVDNQQMAAQLAQFTQLELTEESNKNITSMNETMAKMNSSFEGAMLVAEFDYAKSLLGKEVEFFDSVSGSLVSGKVDKIGVDEATAKPVLAVVEKPDGGGEDIKHAVQLYEVSGIKN